jgi:glycosyltransferase involved in cell wall biosynthesis
MLPEVSVIMSVYNGQDYLRESIESILNQTFKNFEFIIIDDGSTDRSREIINSFSDNRIKLICQENTGLAIALNKGIGISCAPLIARMDADDIALPERLEIQMRFLKEDKGYVLVGSNAIVIDMNDEFVFQTRLPLTWEEIQKNFPESSFLHSSVVFSKEVFHLCGGYFEEISMLYSFEDSILWNKIKDYGKMANIATPLLKYRLTPTAATTKSGREAQVAAKVLIDIVKEGKLSLENRGKLLSNKSLCDKNERLRNYYIHLAKKYLWDNYQPVTARKNLKNALKIAPIQIFPIILFIVSLFPKNIIRILKKY